MWRCRNYRSQNDIQRLVLVGHNKCKPATWSSTGSRAGSGWNAPMASAVPQEPDHSSASQRTHQKTRAPRLAAVHEELFERHQAFEAKAALRVRQPGASVDVGAAEAHLGGLDRLALAALLHVAHRGCAGSAAANAFAPVLSLLKFIDRFQLRSIECAAASGTPARIQAQRVFAAAADYVRAPRVGLVIVEPTRPACSGRSQPSVVLLLKPPP
jgi:hypothetical protein